jgi:hypothetical protein
MQVTMPKSWPEGVQEKGESASCSSLSSTSKFDENGKRSQQSKKSVFHAFLFLLDFSFHAHVTA